MMGNTEHGARKREGLRQVERGGREEDGTIGEVGEEADVVREATRPGKGSDGYRDKGERKDESRR